jgi:hypothetical protein
MRKYDVRDIVRALLYTNCDSTQKNYRFYGNELKVSVSPSNKLLYPFRSKPRHFVKLRISAPDRLKKRIDSVIDTLQLSNGSSLKPSRSMPDIKGG